MRGKNLQISDFCRLMASLLIPNTKKYAFKLLLNNILIFLINSNSNLT